MKNEIKIITTSNFIRLNFIRHFHTIRPLIKGWNHVKLDLLTDRIDVGYLDIWIFL